MQDGDNAGLLWSVAECWGAGRKQIRQQLSERIRRNSGVHHFLLYPRKASAIQLTQSRSCSRCACSAAGPRDLEHLQQSVDGPQTVRLATQPF